MNTRIATRVSLLASALLLAACAGPNQAYGGYGSAPVTSYPASSYPAASYPAANYPATTYPPARGPSYTSVTGVVEAIDMTSAPQSGIGAGTVIGGILGGFLGNQVGGGVGNTVATVAGAVGGAVAGNQIEKRTNQRSTYNVRVRLDNGSHQTVTQDNVADLRIGDRVRVENGYVYRY